MSIKVMTEVWEKSIHKGTYLLLLLSLADHASDDGVCWPSIARLARRIRLQERQVKRLIGDLVGSGELYYLRNVGRGNTNLYLVTVGFSQEEIATTLVKRFNLSTIEAAQLAEKVLSKTPFEPVEKVSSRTIKGVIQGKKVSSETIKGDIAMSPRTVMNHHENRQRTPSAGADIPASIGETSDPETTAWITDLEATVPPVSNPPHSADEFKAQLLATEGRMWDRIRAEPWLSWGVDCSALDTYDGKGQTMRRLGYELESRFGLKPTWSSKKATKAWLMGLADCLDASGGDMTPVLDAATKLLHDGLTVSGPTSLVKTTRALAAQKTIHLNGTPKVLRVG